MSKATEAALAELHGAVATTLTAAMNMTSEDGIPVPPPAAHIMAAITFLKNNNITADASSNTELIALQKALAEKRQTAKKRMSPSVLSQVVDQLDRELGGDTEGVPLQ